MTTWQRWVQRPQDLWVRKAFFQVHLWTGLGIGLYVVAISVSGSALVYLPEVMNEFSRRTVIVADSGRRMSPDEIIEHAQRAYPTYEVDNVRQALTPEQPDDVVLERAHKRIERLFDPYTGADLGDRYTAIEHVFAWLADLHNDLLGGNTGRLVNGIASCLLTLLSLTGAILWWPGIKQWRRSTKVKWDARFPRFNWDLHSAIGFWCWVVLFAWGISGIYFCLPAILGPPIHPRDRFGDSSFLLTLIARLHVGDFNQLTKGDRNIAMANTEKLDTHRKALTINLDPSTFGSFGAGFVDTPLSASLLGDQLDARREQLRKTLPVRRVIGPEDIAALAVHIMTNTALTGGTYDIDGGQQLVEAGG